MGKNVFKLSLPPIHKVKIAFIGVGVRGIEAVKRYMHLNVEIVAICDIHSSYIEKAKQITNNKNILFFNEYNDWKKVCELPNVDLIYISTQWNLHTHMAIYAMEKGKNVALEVPMAMNISDCWNIVKTAEKTQKHCMMLENTCYDLFELSALQMIKKGMLGEIIHAEGSYIHDLRRLNFQQNDRDTLRGEWRIEYSKKHNGNPYPTHGIAPICQAMSILRGDTLSHLVSMSSLSFGMKKYAETTFGNNSEQAKIHFEMGDMNTTLIQTKKGKTIVLQHDVTSPRPYSRTYLISGSNGFLQKYPTMQMAFDPNGMEALCLEEITKILEENKHPFVKETEYLQKLLPEQKPMDIIMDYRLIHCLENGLPLDQNVYDGALWSCLVELTELSVKKGSIPIEIPDFTNEFWKNQI